MKRANVYLAEGFEEIEALTVVDVLRRAGVETTMVSVSNSREVKGAHNIITIADQLYDEYDNHGADLLVLPGGMPGTANLEKHEELAKLIREFNQAEKYVGAICAAPSILGKLGLLENSSATCYPGFEKHLKGALLSDQLVVRHNNIVTAKGAGAAMLFALSLTELLVGAEIAEAIKQSMIVQS